MKTQLRISKSDREKVLHKYDCRCAYCGKPITSDTLALDSNNGNINPSCLRCKRRKGSKTIEQFRSAIAREHYRLVEATSRFKLCKDFGMVKEVTDNIVFYFEKREAEIAKLQFNITTNVAYTLPTPRIVHPATPKNH